MESIISLPQFVMVEKKRKKVLKEEGLVKSIMKENLMMNCIKHYAQEEVK